MVLGNSTFTQNNILLDPGAELFFYTTKPNKEFTIIENNIYTCKDTLANGIALNLHENTIIDFHGNRVRDCYKGFDMVTNGIMAISGNDFENNVIGLHFNARTASTSKLRIRESIHSNTFKGSATNNLKKPYTAMSVSPYHGLMPSSVNDFDKPWAGIMTSGYYIMGIGGQNSAFGTSFGENTFENLYHGIILDRGDYTIRNCRFTNMLTHPTLVHQRPQRTGASILTNSDNTNMYYIHPGSIGVHGSTMDGGTYGLLNDGFNIEKFDGTTIKNVDYGIYSIPNSYRGNNKVSISNNSIDANQAGILFFDYSTDKTEVYINTNTITLKNSISNGAMGIGLFSGNSSYKGTYSNSTMRVNGNVITSDLNTNFHSGVNLMNFRKKGYNIMEISANSINLPNASIDHIGVAAYNSDVAITQNTITSTGTSSNLGFSTRPIGISTSWYEGGISCNTVDNIRTGIRMQGISTDAKLTKNKFKTHYHGLRLETFCEIDPNFNKNTGNTFAGALAYDAYSVQNNMTRFEVGQMADPKYNPNDFPPSLFIGGGSGDDDNCNTGLILGGGLWTIYIKHIIHPIYGSGDIKKINGGWSPVMGLANPSGNGGSQTQDIVSEVSLTDVDTAVLSGSLSFDEYEADMIWQLNQELYQKLEPYRHKYPDTGNNIFYNFVNGMENTNMDEFVNMMQQAQAMVETSATQQDQLDDWHTALDSLTQHYFDLDSIFKVNTDTSMEDSLSTLLSNAFTDRSYYIGLIEGYYTSEHPTILAEAQEIINNNDTITNTEGAAALQQEFINVYYQTYGIGNTALTDSQLMTYEVMAARCPMENADVVYRSRAVVKMYNDTIIYNDSVICAAIGISYKYRDDEPARLETKKMTCVLYPNPTDRYTTIQFNEIPEGIVSVSVYNIKGDLMFTDSRELNTNFMDIDTKSYSSGIYNVVVNTQKENFDFKLSVIR